MCRRRLAGQLSAALQHNALHVLQHQQPLHGGVTQRLQLLAVHAAAHDSPDEPRPGRAGPGLHQSLLRLRGAGSGGRRCTRCDVWLFDDDIK